MSVVIVLYGPKAAGKTWVASVLRDRLHIDRVDPNPLVLDLTARGIEPDPEDGWLIYIVEAVRDALQRSVVVSTEATGAWDSDWRLAERCSELGARVIRAWISAPLDETLARLRRGRDTRYPVEEAEARRIYAAATANAQRQSFDLSFETGELPDADEIAARFRAFLE